MHAPQAPSLPAFDERLAEALQRFPLPFASVDDLGAAMHELLSEGLASLPLPASGQTLDRWRALAAIGAADLSLAKLYESHADALAILAELDSEGAPGLWAVWAAEPPNLRVTYTSGGTLTGEKAWCSGAAVADYGLVSAWTEEGAPIVAKVHLHQAGVTLKPGAWQAVGMAASESISVAFDGARAEAVGQPGEYVERPGFWQGGAGIAAVWYGAAAAIAETLRVSAKVESDPFAAAHLGALDITLSGARALLIETAHWIDANPAADASAAALRVRASVEAAAQEVILRTGRALGPAPLCLRAAHARRCADLPVFLRQSHAEHDLAALGRAVSRDQLAWKL